MSLEIIIPIATTVILLLLCSWLFKVLKSTIKTGLVIVAILILLQIAFGIDSNQIIQEVLAMVKHIQELVLEKLK